MGQITIVHCGVKNKNGIMSRVLRRALSAYGGVQWFDSAAVSCPDQTPRFPALPSAQAFPNYLGSGNLGF